MKRNILHINEDLCNGCGDCVVGCSEGAIKIIDGKARLVREEFCDGFGDCVGTCPTGALTIEAREAPAFDEAATKRYLFESEGIEAVARMESAQRRHNGNHSHMSGGCPGMMQRELRRESSQISSPLPAPAAIIPSELRQWPVQLHLVHPKAPFLKESELVVMNTCGPIASAEVHQRYLRGRSVVVACPKLDNTAPYAEKLATIFLESQTPKVIVVIMEVPCCRGLSAIVQQAKTLSGREDLIIEEHIMSLEGNLVQRRAVPV